MGVIVMVILVAALSGLLAGGIVCLYYLRSAITGDIGPQLKRMHADIDPQLRRMQNQLDLIEYAVNAALATWYADMSSNPLPPSAVPAPRAHDEVKR
jgi:hypothetical protein